jgi:hypothetical protein
MTRVSHLARAVQDARAANEFSAWYLEQFNVAYVGNDEERDVWVAMQSELLDMKQRCDEAEVPFHLIIFPLLFGLDDYAYDAAETEIETFAQRNEIPVFSLTPGFLGRDERELWVSPSDQHPNEEGHRVAAETLFPYLAQAIAP